MTLQEFEPFVEAALCVVANKTAKSRILLGIRGQIESIKRDLKWLEETTVCSHCGQQHCTHILTLKEQKEPMEETLVKMKEAYSYISKLERIPPDQVPVLPLRAIPMDLIVEEVVRRLFLIPAEFPIKKLKVVPEQKDVERVVEELSRQWPTAYGQVMPEPLHVNNEARL